MLDVILLSGFIIFEFIALKYLIDHNHELEDLDPEHTNEFIVTN